VAIFFYYYYYHLIDFLASHVTLGLNEQEFKKPVGWEQNFLATFSSFKPRVTRYASPSYTIEKEKSAK